MTSYAASVRGPLRRLGARWRRMGHDAAYVLAGLPVALFSFSLLTVLLAASISTLVVGVGVLLLPLTLVIGSAFAALSRTRLRRWGAEPGTAQYRSRGPGVLGVLHFVTDARRWLDLVFEMLISLPLRLVTFLIAVLWIVTGPAGLSYFFWSLFLPEEGSLLQLLRLINPELVPQSDSARYLLEAGTAFLLGLAALFSVAPVLRVLAGADAALSTALLGSASAARSFATPMNRSGSAAEAVSFSAAAWSWIGAGFAAIVLLAVGWPVTSAVYSVHAAVALALVGLHCAAVVLSLRWVWAGLPASLVAAVVLMMVTADSGVAVWPWPVTAMITQCAVLAVAAMVRPWYWAASGWCAGALLSVGALLAVSDPVPAGALSTGIVFVSVSAAVTLLGVLVRLWIHNAGELQAAQRSSAQTDRRRKELEERNRIARELHDVVAHSMSVISVQAATAQYRNPQINDDARREFAEIAASSRQALAEMRMLLSILRGNDDVPTAPEPGLEDLDDLIEATRASGTIISYRGLPEEAAPTAARRASDAVGLAAYRIIQEALSNALRHAPAARVSVDLELVQGTTGDQESGGETLWISVINGPPPQPVTVPAPGAGLGLKGIRERAAAVGGTAEAGSQQHPGGGTGFRVHAALPL